MGVLHGTLEALKVWQALCFRDISQKQTRKSDFSRRDSKGIWETRRTPTVARFLHPLLPDPPPILLKHVTKTSIAVPALPIIHLGTSDPAFLPTLQGQMECLLIIESSNHPADLHQLTFNGGRRQRRQPVNPAAGFHKKPLWLFV